MGIFGLPGQSFVILLTTWLSCSAGVGVAASLYASGIINGEHVTILMPALILMASQIQYMGRLLGLADVPKKYWPLLMVIIAFSMHSSGRRSRNCLCRSLIDCLTQKRRDESSQMYFTHFNYLHTIP
ncbi:MAG: hypothetical protein ACLVHE_03340 [Dialister invisus]